MLVGTSRHCGTTARFRVQAYSNPDLLAGCLSVGRLKDLGNQAFKAGQIRFAKPKWERAIRLMDRLLDAETEEQVGPQRLGLWAVRILL